VVGTYDGKCIFYTTEVNLMSISYWTNLYPTIQNLSGTSECKMCTGT
jgi:hypothetical protein